MTDETLIECSRCGEGLCFLCPSCIAELSGVEIPDDDGPVDDSTANEDGYWTSRGCG